MVAVTLCALVAGCSRDTSVRSFDQEFALTLRAGQGELSDAEKSELLRQNHPILAQVGEPSIKALVEMFAALPDQDHAKLKSNSYLKWRLSELPMADQTMVHRVIRFAVQTHSMVPLPVTTDSELIPGLKSDEVYVGFAIVEMEQTAEKVVSWYAYSPQLPMPLWVTIVNTPAAKSEDYVRSHMQRLPLLRTMKPDPPPSVHGRFSYIVNCQLAPGDIL